MKMDSSFTEEDEEERVAPLAERLAKKKGQGCHPKTLSISGKESTQVSFEEKKIEKKRDLDLSVKESSTEPLKKKVKQDSGSGKGMTDCSDSHKSGLDSGPGVLSSVGNLCGSAIHQNHLQRQLKQKDTKSAVSLEKGALTSCDEKQSKLSSYKTCMTEKSSDGPQSKNGVLSNHEERLLPRIDDSTKDGSRTDVDSLSGNNLQKEYKLTNGIKQKGGESDEREQKAKRTEDSTFAVGKFYLGSIDNKGRGRTENQKREKERHGLDHTRRKENGRKDDAGLTAPSRPSKGKQLVTKNGKVKSKGKGSHERDSHSSKDERGVDEARSKKGVEGDAVVGTGYHGDESDGDLATSPIFKRSKHVRELSDGRRDNSRKVSDRVSNESELSGRHSRHLTHEKLNLERKYPTSPKSSKGRQSCIHSNRSMHRKVSHNQSKDVDSTSQGSHHRDERSYERHKESLRYHHAKNTDERRMWYRESTENISEDSSSSSRSRSDEKPTSSPRYNKFLPRNQKSPKFATKDFPSRSSGREHDLVTTSPKYDKVDKRHKRRSSRDCNLPSTERVSPVSENVRSSCITSNTQFKKSQRSKGERDKRQFPEVTSSSHMRDDRKRSLRSRHDKSVTFSQGARSDCRFANVTSEVSLLQVNSATSQNNSSGYDIGGIGTSRHNAEDIYVHDITSPDIFSDEDNFIEEVDVITSGRGHRRRGSSQGNRQSVTEVIDDDDSVILLDDEMGRNSTPPDRRRRESGLSIEDGGNITPRTAAAINQLEADEAMARRLQLEFDQEEAYVRTPPQPEELGITENFHPGEGQFARRIVHSYIPELYSSVITFGMGQGMMPWVQSTVETRNLRRGGNQRGRGSRRRQHVHIEHLYHQAEDDYERLLELEEQLGPAISQGLPPEILTQLPTFKFQEDSKAKAKEDERSCTICMADYEVNENLRRLPCFHAYHRDCIDRWFQMRRSRRIQGITVKPVDETFKYCAEIKDKTPFEKRFISDKIGWDIITNTPRLKEETILKYAGDEITALEAYRREICYEDEDLGSYMFYFGRNKCSTYATIDNGHLGRFVNDAVGKKENCIMKPIKISDSTRLCSFAKRDIDAGEELRYDYGIDDLPWRKNQPSALDKGHQEYTWYDDDYNPFEDLTMFPHLCCEESSEMIYGNDNNVSSNISLSKKGCMENAGVQHLEKDGQQYQSRNTEEKTRNVADNSSRCPFSLNLNSNSLPSSHLEPYTSGENDPGSDVGDSHDVNADASSQEDSNKDGCSKTGRVLTQEAGRTKSKNKPSQYKQMDTKKVKCSSTRMRRPWSTEETEGISHFFEKNLRFGRVPRKGDCEECKRELTLDDRTWRDIKTKVYNLIKAYNRKKN